MIVIRLALALLPSGVLLATPADAQIPALGEQAPVMQAPSSKSGQSPGRAPQDAELKESTANALRSLAAQLAEKRQERAEELAKQLGKDDQRIAELDAEIQDLRWQFAGLMTQIDVQQFEAPETAQMDLLTELVEALRPVVGALKDVTDGARRKHELKRTIEEAEQRLETSIEARTKLDRTVTALRQLEASPATTIAIEQAIIERNKHWVPTIARLENQLLVANENLQQLQDSEGGWLTSLQEKGDDITKGALSIVISIVVFLLVLFGLRALFRLIRGKQRQQTFHGRLTDIVLGSMTLVAAVAATLVVPYSREDYVLLTLGIIIIVGTCWVLAKSAPGYVEQIRLFLNIGSVREGERILVDGLPYRVEALRFYSKLRNPELTGGTLRVPIGQLIGQRSRAAAHDEPWFPCKQGDIVSIEGIVGRVALQTPEIVTFIERNDALRTYPTAAFLKLNPRNLSAGFEVGATFGIDYSHQADSVDKIPELLREAILSYYANDVDAAEVVRVHVELSEAAANSLDYRVQVEFTGKAAPRYETLNRMVSQALVTACTKHGLGIPFPQLQVHGTK
jgi:hypothetical protein